MKLKLQKECYTVKDLIEMFPWKEQTLRKEIRDNRFPAGTVLTTKKQKVWFEDEIVEWIQTRREETKTHTDVGECNE